MSTSAAAWAGQFPERLGRGVGFLQLESCIAASYRDLMSPQRKALMRSVVVLAMLSIPIMLGSRCKDEHLKVDEEPPEGGGVGRG